MYAKIYKNNNVHLYGEPDYDGNDLNIYEVIECIENSLDCPDTFSGIGGDYFPTANYGAGWWIALWVNGKPREYCINEDDIERLNQGKRIILRDGGAAPVFTLPSYYNYDRATYNGIPGYGYHLCDEPSQNCIDELESWGCTFLTAQYRYAPEMKHKVVFVPNGICFSFC